MQSDPRPVVCVDLDGSLLATDSLLEGMLRLLHVQPWALLSMPLWLLRGRAFFKMQVAKRVSLAFDALPVNDEVLAWCRAQQVDGARLWLCTGSSAPWAQQAARHFGLFEGVLCSDDSVNLTGRAKASRLVAEFGDKSFTYCGNEPRDLHIWRHARHAVVVGGAKLAARAREICPVALHVDVRPASAREWLRALRVHQWAKNLLVFVPLLAAHRAPDPAAWQQAGVAFAAFCLAASAVYLLNDLLDLPADRAHPRKRDRPLASGRLPLKLGIAGVPVLALSSALLASQAGMRFCAVLAGYALVTLVYSWGLKRVALVDTLTLAALYTLRLLAGAVAVQVPLSFWLLAFSGFLFFSLALVKRSAELRSWQRQGEVSAPAGRGYHTSDLPLVDAIGIASGLLSVLVLALYLNSPDVRLLYARPYVLWGLCPLLVWWVCRVWLLVHRGAMHDDPVVFALRDRASLLGAGIGAVLVWAAT